MLNENYLLLIPLLPLAGFVLLGLFGRKYFKNASGIIGTVLLLTSALLSFTRLMDIFLSLEKWTAFMKR